MASFTESAGLVRSSSDGEDMYDAAPHEIRSARRSASVALAVSAVMCLFSAALLVHTQSENAAAVPASSSAVVGLNADVDGSPGGETLKDELHGLFNEVREVEYGMRPVPYHLVTNSLLRAHASSNAEVVRDMPANCQVFPLKKQGNWIQVVVPSNEVDGAQVDAAFGWLPAKEDGIELLEQDSELRTKRRQRRSGPPPSHEEVAATWDQVRAKNANLKAELAKLQASMHESLHHPAGQTADQREQAKEQFRAKVTEVIDVNELSKTVSQIRSDVKKELDSPKELLNKIGDAFA